jgi:hypothetical protein
MTLHKRHELWPKFRPAITRSDQPLGCRYRKVVQQADDNAAVPEKGLSVQVVDAHWVAELDVLDGFVERKVGAEETDQDIASWPVFYFYSFTRGQMQE